MKRAGTSMASTRDRRVATWSQVFYAKDARKEILQKEGGSQVVPARPRAILMTIPKNSQRVDLHGRFMYGHAPRLTRARSLWPLRALKSVEASAFLPGQMVVPWLRAVFHRFLSHRPELALESVTREFPLHEREVILGGHCQVGGGGSVSALRDSVHAGRKFGGAWFRIRSRLGLLAGVAQGRGCYGAPGEDGGLSRCLSSGLSLPCSINVCKLSSSRPGSKRRTP